jgi:hypothetical protein
MKLAIGNIAMRVKRFEEIPDDLEVLEPFNLLRA